jgi:hypothetical protein
MYQDLTIKPRPAGTERSRPKTNVACGDTVAAGKSRDYSWLQNFRRLVPTTENSGTTKASAWASDRSNSK